MGHVPQPGHQPQLLAVTADNLRFWANTEYFKEANGHDVDHEVDKGPGVKVQWDGDDQIVERDNR